MGLTQVDTGDQREFTRAVEIISPDETLITDFEESYMMEEGTEGAAYYRIEESAEPREWVIEQLENKHGDVEATQDWAPSSLAPFLSCFTSNRLRSPD